MVRREQDMARENLGSGTMTLGQGGQNNARDAGQGTRQGLWQAYLLGLVDQVLELPRWLIRLGLAAAGVWLLAMIGVGVLLVQDTLLTGMAGRMALAVAVTLPTVSLGLLAAVVLRLSRENRQLTERMREQGGVDLLTGIAGRANFSEACEREFVRFRRYGHPLAVIRLNVDFFNRLSDAYGDDVADQLLMRLASLMAAEVRDSDLIGRLGEAEFAALLPGVDSEGASQPASRICEGAARLSLPSDLGDLHFTVSVGVAHAEKPDRDGQALLRRAKVALGAAVFAGRNRVALSDGVLLFPLRSRGDD